MVGGSVEREAAVVKLVNDGRAVRQRAQELAAPRRTAAAEVRMLAILTRGCVWNMVLGVAVSQRVSEWWCCGRLKVPPRGKNCNVGMTSKGRESCAGHFFYWAGCWVLIGVVVRTCGVLG